MTLTTSSMTARRQLENIDTDPTGVDAALIAAAWRVLERSGYRSLKIRQVLNASHSSASAFYRRFPSKAHLVLTLMQTEADRAVDVVAKRLGETDDPREQLTHWLRFHIKVLYDHRRRARALMFSDPEFIESVPAAVQHHRLGLYNQVVEIARRGMESGAFSTDDPDCDADAVWRLIRGLVYDPLAAQPDVPFEVTVQRTERHALRLLGGQL